MDRKRVACTHCNKSLEGAVCALAVVTKHRGRTLMKAPIHSLRLCSACLGSVPLGKLMGKNTRIDLMAEGGNGR